LNKIPEFSCGRLRRPQAGKSPKFFAVDWNFSKCRISDFETENKFFEKIKSGYWLLPHRFC